MLFPIVGYVELLADEGIDIIIKNIRFMKN